MNKSYIFINNIISKNSIKLSDLEKEILNNLLKSSIEIYDSNISELSKKFYVSNSTITRFAKKLGYDGFNELKFALQNIDDSPIYLTQKIYSNILDEVPELDPKIVKFIQNIDRFNKIVIVGIGSSGLVANEAMYKFGEMGLKNLDSAKEPYSINLLAKGLGENDLFIVLSLSGENRNILEGLEIAKSNNTTVLSITEDKNSTLVQQSDYYLLTPTYSTFEYTISKMFPLLTYIDIICEIYSRKI